MRSLLKKISWEDLVYFIISLIGIALFSYNIHETSLVPDELSAIERSNFNSLTDLFKYSISSDSHPPLIQVFLYFWIKLVGDNNIWIKLPFLIMAIFSIPLMYQLATRWFSKNVALLSLSFFISIQFTVMHAQMARPYISGLFLSLLLALFWTKIIKNKAKTLHYFGYTLVAILLSYNHYYGTIQAGIIGILGLFFIKKNNLLKYFIANGIVIISFLIYLPYFLIQMKVEGLSYITEPEITFIFDFLLYIFQFSHTSIFVAIGIVCLSIMIAKKVAVTKFTLVAFLFFLLPFTIGYIYSVTIRPILLFRSLIHAFPFLIIFIFSFSLKLKKPIVILCCILILSANTYSLIHSRKHYVIAKKGIAKAAVLNTMNFVNDGNKPAVLFNLSEFNLKYYYKLYGANFKYINMFKNIPLPKEFEKRIKTISNDNIITLNIPENFVSIVNDYFPYYQLIDYGHNFNYYIFSKNPLANQPENIIDTTLSFSDKINQQHIINDSISHNAYYLFEAEEEWGPSLTIPIGKLISNNHQIIESSISILSSNQPASGILVFEIKDGNNQLAWRGEEIKNWTENLNKWEKIHYSIQLNNIVDASQITSNTELSIYYWNKNKGAVAIDNLSIKIRRGNQLVYSLLETIPE